MKISQSIVLLVLVALTAIAHAGNTNSDSVGYIADPPPFELMDLTALLNSLNVTYEQLAQNLSTLNSSTPASTDTAPPAANPTTPPPTTPAQKQQKKSNVANSSVSSTTLQSKSTDSNKTPPVITQPPIAIPKPTPAPATDQSKPQSVSPPPTSTATVQTKTTKQDAQTQTTSTPATATSTKGSTASTSTTPLPPSTNNFPTYGPGPSDKSLPPVIDISKLVVDTPLPKPQQTTAAPAQTSSQPKPSTPTTSSQSTQTPTEQPQTKNIQTQTTSQPEKKPEPVKSLTSNDDTPKTTKNNPTPTTPTPTPTPTPTQQAPSDSSSSSQKNVNEVYLAPVVTPTPPTNDKDSSRSKPSSNLSPSKDTDSTPKISSNSISVDNRKDSGSPASYQCWNSDADAIYSITPSYKAFSKYFIISSKDAFLPAIQTYLLSNYGNYLSGAQTVAGFRLYNPYGDSLDYQLLLSTNFGTFVAILTFWPDSGNIQLKSLSILNFFIMEIDYSNCQEQDTAKQNCRVCEEGFRNYFGRCQPFDRFCGAYITDECGQCGGGRKLISGTCV